MDRECACSLLSSKSRERLGGVGGALGKAVCMIKCLNCRLDSETPNRGIPLYVLLKLTKQSPEEQNECNYSLCQKVVEHLIIDGVTPVGKLGRGGRWSVCLIAADSRSVSSVDYKRTQS